MKRNNGKWDLLSYLSAALVAVIVLTLAFYAVISVAHFSGSAKKKDGSGKISAGEKDESVAESKATVTETKAEKTKAETTAPETAARDENHEIRTLTAEELLAIAENYSTETVGFGTEGTRDANNRPEVVNDFVASAAAKGIGVVCYCSDENTKKVAFTFQAGDEYGYTEQILDILDNYGIKATFYITYSFAVTSAENVKRMISEGHEIGSHSYTCPDDGIASMELEDQMSDAINLQNYMKQAFNYNMSKYNFNSSVWSDASGALMDGMGYEICFFSANYADYSASESYDANEKLALMEERLCPGCVYCFHMSNEVTVRMLPGLIEYCLDQGYTITQLN